jgi:flavin reductase (DIM6/NTAB) family NADH-FMN oxidoreductase RutF
MDSKAFRKISYGLYIVTSRKGDKINGQTVDAAFQVTSSSAPLQSASTNKT